LLTMLWIEAVLFVVDKTIVYTRETKKNTRQRQKI